MHCAPPSPRPCDVVWCGAEFKKRLSPLQQNQCLVPHLKELFHKAAKELNDEMMIELLQINNELIRTTTDEGDKAIHLVMKGRGKEDDTMELLKCMKVLVECMPDSMYQKGSDGEEPLMWVCKNNLDRILEVMLENCPYDRNDFTECPDGEFVEHLTTPYYRNGENVEENEKLYLQVAVESGSLDCAKLLMINTRYVTLWHETDEFR